MEYHSCHVRIKYNLLKATWRQSDFPPFLNWVSTHQLCVDGCLQLIKHPELKLKFSTHKNNSSFDNTKLSIILSGFLAQKLLSRISIYRVNVHFLIDVEHTSLPIDSNSESGCMCCTSVFESAQAGSLWLPRWDLEPEMTIIFGEYGGISLPRNWISPCWKGTFYLVML